MNSLTQFFLPPLPSKDARTPTRKEASTITTAIARRKEVYDKRLWAKHVASNGFTGYRANPTPRDFVVDGASAARALTFLNRELRIWDSDDHTAEHIVTLLRSVDIRSPVAIALLHPLIGSYEAAQHLAHELYSFLRSPFSALDEYDAVVHYDEVAGDAYPEAKRDARWENDSLSSTTRSRSRSRSRSRFRSRSRSRSRSWSPGSRSRSRSRSHDRDLSRPDTFVPPPSRGERRWDEPDSWVDPEYERELLAAGKRRKRKEQRTRQRERRREEKELLPAPPPSATFGRALASAGISIRGSAERRASLLERLAKAKGENGSGSPATPIFSPSLHSAIIETPILPGQGIPSPNSDDRATGLRNKLIAERKRKALRDQLMARKRAKAGETEPKPDVEGDEGGAAQEEAT